MPSCSAQLSNWRVPRSADAAAAFQNATRRADAVGTVEAGVRRRVWDLIPLGYEVDMLWLHLKLGVECNRHLRCFKHFHDTHS